jgi:hypothetical protein
LEATTTQCLKSLRIPGAVVTGRENYKDHFKLKKEAASGSQPNNDAGERIVYNDTTVQIGEKTYLLDFTVKSFSQDVMEVSKSTVGAAAKKAEMTKINSILQKYIVPTGDRYKLVPCAAEVTGTFGELFRQFLGKASHHADPDTAESPYGPPASAQDAFDRVVWHHKARIVSSLTRGVVREVNRYMRKVHAACGV